jgi:hypothetical protein
VFSGNLDGNYIKTIIADLPDSAYQLKHWAFSDAVAIFYGRYLTKILK